MPGFPFFHLCFLLLVVASVRGICVVIMLFYTLGVLQFRGRFGSRWGGGDEQEGLSFDVFYK